MTNIVFAHALYFKIAEDGSIFTPGGIDNRYLSRFTKAEFREIFLVSRSSPLKKEDLHQYRKLDFINSMFLTSFTGGYSFLFRPSFYKKLYRVLKDDALLIINFPSVTGLFLVVFACIFRFDFVVEVASDSNQYRQKKFGLLIDSLCNIVGKVCVPKAVGALYVTEFLRDKWFCSTSIILSNVIIKEIKIPRTYQTGKCFFKIVTVGAISYRKGIDFLIHELRSLNRNIHVELHIVGPKIDIEIVELINQLNSSKLEVICHGILSPEEVVGVLDGSDIYIQASRSEGLPRSVIEAMARGLPVISSRLPGLRDIVDSEFQFDVDVHGSLVMLLDYVFQSSETLNIMSRKSIEKASNFDAYNLDAKRTEFYIRCKRLMS